MPVLDRGGDEAAWPAADEPGQRATELRGFESAAGDGDRVCPAAFAAEGVDPVDEDPRRITPCSTSGAKSRDAALTRLRLVVGGNLTVHGFTDTIHGLRNHQIHGATLNLHEIYSFCCPAQARPMWVFPVTESWDANLASWPGPAFDGNAVGSVNASYGTTPAWLSIPLPADRMTRWTHWMENFHGFRLAADYGDSYGWKRFSSAQSTQASNVPSLDVLYSVEGASYSLPTGGYTTPVKSVSDGVLPVDVTNWGVSTWQAGGSLGLRQSIVNSAGEDMIAKHGLTAYRHFTVPATIGPHTSVRIASQAVYAE